MQSLLIIADKAILEGLELLPEWLPVPDHGGIIGPIAAIFMFFASCPN